jgi:hypothetical protein
LDSLPQVELDAIILESKDTDGVTEMTVKLTNNTSTVAVMTRLKVMQGNTEKRVLPVYYDDNYFAMLPGEAKVVNIEFETKYADGSQPVLRMEGYNTASAVITQTGATVSKWELAAKAQYSDAASSNCVDVMVTAKNYTDSGNTINIFAAAYNGKGALLSISKMELTVPSRSSKSTVWFSTMALDENKDICKVKVFAWESSSYIPVGEAGETPIMPAGTY